MDRTVIRFVTLASALAAAPFGAAAHQLLVFASVDCETVTVEAKFSNGRAARQGDVMVFDGDKNLLMTLELENDGTANVPLDDVDHSGGLLIEVDTGSHDNYWIVTLEDIARNCRS